MKKKLLGGLLAAMLLVGVMAPAAFADVEGAGVFDGTAKVGKWFRANAPCTKDGIGEPEGPGLYFPVIQTVKERRAEGVWRFGTTLAMVGSYDPASTDDDGVFTGVFNVCGRLESMVDASGQEVGAACGPSKGFEGKGYAEGVDEDGVVQFRLKLFDIGWKAVVGGVIPVTGSYQEYTDSTRAVKGKKGSVYAIVNAAPANEIEIQRCANLHPDGNGAKDFRVTGVFDLINTYYDKGKGSPGSILPEPPRENGKSCKDDGPKDKAGPKPDVGPEYCKDPGPQKPKP